MTLEDFRLNGHSWLFLEDPQRFVSAARGTFLGSTTARQFETARDILSRLAGSHGRRPQRGLLLADDVGLGKTSVAAIVAWVVARGSPELRRVRILAPNAVMRRRWVEELERYRGPLRQVAPHLDVRSQSIKGTAAVKKLKAGQIQVTTHYHASSASAMACHLLIVDEAHRARGEETGFHRALRGQAKHARRILFLTATPFSIDLAEFENILRLVGAGHTCRAAVGRYKRALKELYSGDSSRDVKLAADELASRAAEAVANLANVVIRHSIEDLPRERPHFGNRTQWEIPVVRASYADVELLLRVDRALRLARGDGPERTNDARFHVGWAVLCNEATKLARSNARNDVRSDILVLRRHGKLATATLTTREVHPKMLVVAREVSRRIINEREKILVFCHHHATAAELALVIAENLETAGRKRGLRRHLPDERVWLRVWERLLANEQTNAPSSGYEEQRALFARWLSSPGIRSQILDWIGYEIDQERDLVRALTKHRVRGHCLAPTIAKAARELLRALTDPGSSSTLGVLRAAVRQNSYDLLPGGGRRQRALALCEPPPYAHDHDNLFFHDREPDIVLAVFNSAFGPDALVVTDRLSEGVDLHRYCRLLVHYELNPSPIRTIQRNGRVRRVGSWAARTRQDVEYAYPSFGGTRDEKLVRVVRGRLDNFDLLLGGVAAFEPDSVIEQEERWRAQVIGEARERLRKTNLRLVANPPS